MTTEQKATITRQAHFSDLAWEHNLLAAMDDEALRVVLYEPRTEYHHKSEHLFDFRSFQKWASPRHN